MNTSTKPGIDFRRPGLAIDRSEVDGLERTIGCGPIPEDYRSYLLRFNGATPFHKAAFPDRSSRVRIWWPVGSTAALHGHAAGVSGMYRIRRDATMGEDLAENQAVFAGRIPEGTLALGSSPGGSQLLLDLRPHRPGQVLYWSRPHESDVAWRKNQFHNVGWIANDFVDFINRIEAEPDDWDAWEASLPADSTHESTTGRSRVDSTPSGGGRRGRRPGGALNWQP